MPAQSRPPAPQALPQQRRQQLLGFLRTLHLDPSGPGGPGGGDAVLAPIEEALTHTSAGQRYSHERLEFLGDAVLRLAASEYLQHHHRRLRVGQHSALRAQLVSDRWLADLAESCGLEPLLQVGPRTAGDRTGRRTVLAESCEALIGGIYEAWGGGSGGLGAVHRWLDPHWERDTAALLADPDRHNWKQTLQEWTQGRGLGLPRYGCQERSRVHGDPRRFHCQVDLPTAAGSEGVAAEGWGGSRREAEQQAARAALERLRQLQLRPAPGP
ncbi:MAG: ribonuclease III family protein [Synechococcus sp.]